jgi:hypothetical protein
VTPVRLVTPVKLLTPERLKPTNSLGLRGIERKTL